MDARYIYQRFKAGDSIDRIAGLTAEDKDSIEDVLRAVAVGIEIGQAVAMWNATEG